jgi:signal transduction histidine kinase
MRWGFAAVATLFFILVATAMVLLSRANQDYGRLAVERQAAQAASLLQASIGIQERLLAYREDAAALTGDLPEVMERVRGIALFDGQGKSLFAWGSALPEPRRLEAQCRDISNQPFGDQVIWNGSTVYYLKNQVGGPRQRLMNQLLNGRRQRDRLAAGQAAMMPGLLLVEYDGADLLGSMYLRQSLILALGGVALALLGGLGWLFLRMQRLHADLDEQRALARLGTAARTLAHEVRNPLSIIITQKSLLERQLGPEHQAALASIGEEAKRIEFQIRQVNQALGSQPAGNAAIGRAAAGPATAVPEAPAFHGDPGPWLGALAGSLPTWRGRVELVPPLAANPAVTAPAGIGSLAPRLDGEQLRSIVANLVDNALEAYAAAGRADGPVRLAWWFEVAAGRSPRLILEVADRAGGVPRSIRRRIFDPFFTTKPHGSGVGLNLARELARSAGGDISYHFVRPHGSRFRVELPLDRPEATAGGRP